jgi:proline dehydrogenase
VKGAYDPPAEIAYRDAERVNRAYEDLLALAFREFEGEVAVGTHDDRMIERARELAAEHDRDFEVQMLMGVREDYQRELAAERDVWQYVPYGGKWASYFYRRVAERKENALFALRAVFGGFG